MNSLDYIDNIFKIALNQYQNKDEVPVEVSQGILLSVHNTIKVVGEPKEPPYRETSDHGITFDYC